MKLRTIGIDLAKNVFQVCGVNDHIYRIKEVAGFNGLESKLSWMKQLIKTAIATLIPLKSINYCQFTIQDITPKFAPRSFNVLVKFCPSCTLDHPSCA